MCNFNKIYTIYCTTHIQYIIQYKHVGIYLYEHLIGFDHEDVQMQILCADVDLAIDLLSTLAHVSLSYLLHCNMEVLDTYFTLLQI